MLAVMIELDSPSRVNYDELQVPEELFYERPKWFQVMHTQSD